MKKSVIKELFGEAISYAEKMRVEDEEYYRQLEVAEIKEKRTEGRGLQKIRWKFSKHF